MKLSELKNEKTTETVLRELVLDVMVLVNEPQADWQYHVEAALADPVDALTCYKAIKREFMACTIS